ncbi:MAG: hypothetical protein KAV00_18265, partial [Phycisphaerae bacterium]|nr:hypothetical protein [Phycisphaerae bacterium]
ASAAILFLEVDPSEIDVNVHPTKIEIRFSNGQTIHSQLLAVLRETLNNANVTAALDIDRAEVSDSGGAGDGRREGLKQALADFFKSKPPTGQTEAPAGRTGQYAAGDFHRTPSASHGYAGAPTLRQPLTQVEEVLPVSIRLPIRALQVHNSYIVTATDTGLEIIDQHALHERIIFDELKTRIASGHLASQRLLIPETVELAQADKTILSERADMLERFGLEVTDFGPGSVAVHALPSLLVERNVPAAEFVRDLLETLAENASAGGDELLDKILATMACKAAVKAGENLTPEEIDSLLGRRTNTASCPHGRPTTLTLTLAELEKQFKRT